MLAAELHGKIADSSPPNQRLEDVLTSYVFSLFHYLNNLRLPGIFLQQAIDLEHKKPFDLQGIQAADVYFWPRFRFPGTTYREGDALLVLTRDTGEQLAIMVECKYGSGLSNRSEEESEQQRPGIPRDNNIELAHQLADEYCGIQCGSFSRSDQLSKELSEIEKRLLLFITAHHEIPESEMQDAIKSILKRKCSAKNPKDCFNEAKSRLFWVSWRCLQDLLEKDKSLGYQGYSKGEQRLLDDVRKLLKMRNLEVFKPFKYLKPMVKYDALWPKCKGLNG